MPSSSSSKSSSDSDSSLKTNGSYEDVGTSLIPMVVPVSSHLGGEGILIYIKALLSIKNILSLRQQGSSGLCLGVI